MATSKKSKKNNNVVIVEVVIIALALFVIGFGIVKILQKKQNADSSVSGANGVSLNAPIASGESPADILSTSNFDNSSLYDNMPEVPAVDQFVTLTEDEAVALADEGKLIQLTATDGSIVYMTNYSDPEVLNEKLSFTEEELYDYITFNLLLSFPQPVEGRDVCQKYDSVTINFVGTMDGVAFDGGSADGCPLTLGSGSMIPGFEEGIIGMKVGETKDINVTFPEDYHMPDLAGKPAVFTITLVSIDSMPGELTDVLVTQAFTDLTTVDECLEYFRSVMVQSKLPSLFTEDIYVSAISREYIDSYYKSEMDYFCQYCAAYYQMSVIDYLSYVQVSEDEFKTSVMEEACNSAIVSTIFDAVANNEGVTVTDEDYSNFAAQNGCSTIEEFEQMYGFDQQAIKDEIIAGKLSDFFLELIR